MSRYYRKLLKENKYLQQASSIMMVLLGWEKLLTSLTCATELLHNLFHWKRLLWLIEDMQINLTYWFLPCLQMFSEFSLSFMHSKSVFELVRQNCFKFKEVNAFHMKIFYAFFSLLILKNWAIHIRVRKNCILKLQFYFWREPCLTTVTQIFLPIHLIWNVLHYIYYIIQWFNKVFL